ncbi:MAG: hypothetical protein ACKVU1_07510 [bacterium]
MDPRLRALFNSAYTEKTYEAIARAMAERLGGEPIPFRLAETPVFFTPALRDLCERAASEIIAQMQDPKIIALCADRIPPEYRVPGIDALPHSAVVDFAIVRGANGEHEPRLIETQGFPSLYGFQYVMAGAWGEVLAAMPGMPREWAVTLGGGDLDAYRALLRDTIVGDCDPDEVVLVDIEPKKQKTRPDFVATTALLGVRDVCLTELVRRGDQLFAPHRSASGASGLVRVRRIYNRVIFDELVSKGVGAPFDYREGLDVTWVPHPNWYWIWSKATMPYLDHPCVPKARYLADIREWPSDLSRYVLKPLYSFAGLGVVVDVDRSRIDAIPEDERANWLLMEKVDYAPDLIAPDGAGVKVELRVLFLRPDASDRLVPAINLCRLSRGKMHGVDHNKDLDWVGSSVAIWPVRD